MRPVSEYTGDVTPRFTVVLRTQRRVPSASGAPSVQPYSCADATLVLSAIHSRSVDSNTKPHGLALAAW